MKLILLTILISPWCTVDGKYMHGGTNGANKLFQNARRVQQNYNYNQGAGYGGYSGYGGYNSNGGGGDMNDDWFLSDYSLKMISCIQGEESINYEEGQLESSTVIFRLCPKDYCGTSSTTMGCDSGYGDFAVGINTFAEAYSESIKDNYNNGMQYYSNQYGEFNVEEYMRECRLFEGGGGGGNGNYYSGGGYSYAYLGPACTADGTDIRLASFKDPYCSEESDTAFESTHNGMELPYGDGGLIPNNCMDCLSMNNNWEYEVNEMCKKTYENAGYRCEQHMESFNFYYGQNNQGCEYLDSRLTGNNLDKYTNNFANAADSFFQESSKATKMAAGTITLFVLAGLVGAAAVLCLGKKTVQKVVRQRKISKKDVAKPLAISDEDPDIYIIVDEMGDITDIPSVIEFARSTTKKMKATMQKAMIRSTSKSVKKQRNGENYTDNKADRYTNMLDDGKKIIDGDGTKGSLS